MHEFRVTKYDPTARDSSGRYLKSEWTSYSEIGSIFSGKPFTKESYLSVEKAYIKTAISFMQEAHISSVKVIGLENSADFKEAPPEGTILDYSALGDAMRNVLRENFWCRFESDLAFIHFGYDYYMYIGTPGPFNKSTQAAQKNGLYVENYNSPYKAHSV